MLEVGALTTITPVWVAALTSTLSRPTPARATTLSRVAAASASASTLVARADQDRVGVGDRRQQLGAVGAVAVPDLEVGAERLDGGGAELFGDEYDGLAHVAVLGSDRSSVVASTPLGGRGGCRARRCARTAMLPPPVPASHRSGSCDSSRPLSSRARSRVSRPVVRSVSSSVSTSPRRSTTSRAGPTGSASRWSGPAAPACPAAPPDPAGPAAGSPGRRPAARPAPARPALLVDDHPGPDPAPVRGHERPLRATSRKPSLGYAAPHGRGGPGAEHGAGLHQGRENPPAGRAPATRIPGPGSPPPSGWSASGTPGQRSGSGRGCRRTPAPVDGDAPPPPPARPRPARAAHVGARFSPSAGGAAWTCCTVRSGADPGSTPEQVQGRLSGIPDVRGALVPRASSHDHSRVTHQDVRRLHRRRRRHLHRPSPAGSPASSAPTAPASRPRCAIMVGLTPPTSGTATDLRPPVRRPAQPRAARSACCSTPRPSTPAAPAARSSPSPSAPWACPPARVDEMLDLVSLTADRGRPPGAQLLARHAPAARHRHRADRRPGGADPRRAGQRARPGRHPLDARPAPRLRRPAAAPCCSPRTCCTRSRSSPTTSS